MKLKENWKRWEPNDTEYLLNNYKSNTLAELSVHLKRTEKSIQRKIILLGLLRNDILKMVYNGVSFKDTSTQLKVSQDYVDSVFVNRYQENIKKHARQSGDSLYIKLLEQHNLNNYKPNYPQNEMFPYETLSPQEKCMYHNIKIEE